MRCLHKPLCIWPWPGARGFARHASSRGRGLGARSAVPAGAQPRYKQGNSRKQLSALSKLKIYLFLYASVQKNLVALKKILWLVFFNPLSSVASRGSGFTLKGYLQKKKKKPLTLAGAVSRFRPWRS